MVKVGMSPLSFKQSYMTITSVDIIQHNTHPFTLLTMSRNTQSFKLVLLGELAETATLTGWEAVLYHILATPVWAQVNPLWERVVSYSGLPRMNIRTFGEYRRGARASDVSLDL
jgi:hypothetical protein